MKNSTKTTEQALTSSGNGRIEESGCSVGYTDMAPAAEEGVIALSGGSIKCTDCTATYNFDDPSVFRAIE